MGCDQNSMILEGASANLSSNLVLTIEVPTLPLSTDLRPIDEVDGDFTGTPIRNEHVVPGPIQGLKAGTNRFELRSMIPGA